MTERRVLPLREYEAALFGAKEISEAEGLSICSEQSGRLSIDFPTPKSGNRWIVRSEGWVGSFPITPELEFRVAPKTGVQSIYGMLEYAYQLKPQEFPGITDSKSLDEVFEHLAESLARGVLKRSRQGLHASYVTEDDSLPYLRGTLDLRDRVRKPWDTRIRCEFQEHTRDIEDNRIFAWTLGRILRFGWCTPLKSGPWVRRAFQAVRSVCGPEPVTARDCVSRLYSRLNEDYRPLHAVCRFFLEHGGPLSESGDRKILPFALDMAKLFESFVAEWLRQHLPAPYRVDPQYHVSVSKDHNIVFKVDLVLHDDRVKRAVCVLDTKYKTDTSPDSGDIHQIVCYAEAVGCDLGVLIYPSRRGAAAAFPVGARKRVRTVAFDLARPLEEAGRDFLAQVLVPLDSSDGLMVPA